MDSYWDSDFIDEHRRSISDIEWEEAQPNTPPKYMVGDIVEFMAGGYGIIDVIRTIDDTNPQVHYSTIKIPNKEFHPKGIVRWHLEGDIKRLVIESAIRRFDT